jgi:hypothetical protein
MRDFPTCDRDDVQPESNLEPLQMSALEASDGAHFSGCKDMELERNTQEPQDGVGNHQTWLNARTDPFILRFPPEISSHIFFLSMAMDTPDQLYKLPMAFVLGSVCRGWRLLARSTPEIWSKVSFRIGKPSRKPEGLSQLQAVSDWLKLSGDVPLTLHVWGADSVLQEGYASPVINILNEHSGRWHKLFLYIPAPLVRRFCGTSPPRNLCDLHVIGDYRRVPAIFKMRSRPSPTHLTISQFPISTFDINWDNLTFLKMTFTVFDGCIEAIRQAPLLEIFFISLCRMDFLPSIPKITVRHIRLRTLKLLNFPFELLCSFLDVLELPSLQAYHHQAWGLDIAADNITSLLNRSRVNLKQLTLELHRPQGEYIKKLLNAVPCLQHLHLQICCIANACVIHELFEMLSESSLPPILVGDIPGFLPSLQSLTIYTSGMSFWECIPRLFSSPHRKRLRLEVIKLSIEIDKDTLRTILRLVDDGANIRILEGLGRLDYLQQFRGNSREANIYQVPDVVDHAPEGEPGDDDKEGFLTSFSNFISRLFCRAR